MKKTVNAAIISSNLLIIVVLTVACGNTSVSPEQNTDTGVSTPHSTLGNNSGSDVSGQRRYPAALDSFGESKVLATQASSGVVPDAPESKRVAIATPPLPSESSRSNMSGGSPVIPSVAADGVLAVTPAPAPSAATGGALGAMPAPVPSGPISSSAAPARPSAARSRSVRSGPMPAPPTKSFEPREMAEAEEALRPYSRAQQQPQRRILTAGAVADVDHRLDYLGYLQRHQQEAATLGVDMSRRVRFLVVDAQRRPIHDALVTLVGQNGHPVSGRTHTDGIWDFFPGVVAPWMNGSVTVHVTSLGLSTVATVDIPVQGDGNAYVIPLAGQGPGLPNRLDLSFVIDVTGSMGDELRYVNEEITGIVDRVRAAVPQVEVRVASTFYRDRSDGIPLEQIPFSSNLADFVARMRYVQATGGGDYPEDLSSGLAAAMNTLDWSQNGTARVMIVIADAPPQQYGNAQYTYREAMQDASRQGIRIIPVAASGANPTVEYLFRAMGILTSTPYVYLTDDSGIGNPHMEADSQNVSREMFSDLLTRLLIAELQGEGMH